MQLTKNFSYEKMFVSGSHPELAEQARESAPDMLVTTLYLLCRFILQPIRDELQVPIHITSGFRPKKLNRAVGGSKGSLHRQGIAADFTIDDITNDGKQLLLKAFSFARDTLRDDRGELILYEDEEGNFINIHVSLPGSKHQHFAKRKVRMRNGKLKNKET